MNAPVPAPVRDVPRADPPSKARLRLWLKLLRASRQVEGTLRERMRAEMGSTLPRFDVMAALCRAPEGLRMSEVSSRLGVSPGGLTGIVDRLVAEGLVDRRADGGDRRALLVRLTPAGAGEFARLAAAHEGWVDDLFAPLGPGEMAALAALLDRIPGREG